MVLILNMSQREILKVQMVSLFARGHNESDWTSENILLTLGSFQHWAWHSLREHIFMRLNPLSFYQTYPSDAKSTGIDYIESKGTCHIFTMIFTYVFTVTLELVYLCA